MRKLLSAVILAASTIFTPTFAQDIGRAADIGKMDGFWRRGTMVDTWLKSGGGLITIPSYMTDRSASFSYVKRPHSKEYPFADNMVLVRPLGGWDRIGGGESSGFSNIRQADFAWENRSGGSLSYNKALLINRIKPYVDNGYGNGLTVVFDNVPWGLAGPDASLGRYGQKSPARHSKWMYWVCRRATQYMVEEFGSIAASFDFRIGTETEWGERFAGDAWEYFNHYNECVQGIRHNLPKAKVGPGNFTIKNDGGQTANIKEFLGYLETNGAPNVSVDFMSASAYFNSDNTGVDRSAYELTQRIEDYNKSLKRLYGRTVLRTDEFYIDEFGIKNGSEEPGAFGVAHTFEAIARFLANGVDKLQHWKTYEVISPRGNKVLFDAEAGLYTIFDYARGRDASVYYLDGKLNGNATGMGMVIKGRGETIIILSSAHEKRANKPTQNFTFSFNKSDASFSSVARVTKEYLALNQDTTVYDIARDDLAARGLLNGPYRSDPDRLNRIAAMGGAAAENYISNNWSRYTQHYVDSMKLSNYSGRLSEGGGKFHLRVNGMKTPSVMVFRLKNP